jgi:hypothetical protein
MMKSLALSSIYGVKRLFLRFTSLVLEEAAKVNHIGNHFERVGGACSLKRQSRTPAMRENLPLETGTLGPARLYRSSFCWGRLG